MDRELESMTQWLEKCYGQQLVIDKLEQEDHDLTELLLEKITVNRPANAHADDYLNGSRLVLHGAGSLLNTTEHPPLPGNQYEIPMPGELRVAVQKDTLLLVTERAEYKIMKNINPLVH